MDDIFDSHSRTIFWTVSMMLLVCEISYDTLADESCNNKIIDTSLCVVTDTVMTYLLRCKE